MPVFPPATPLSQEHLSALIHKLRGPLAAISAQAETLAEGILGPLSPAQAEAVRSIRLELCHSLHQLDGLEELWLQRPADLTASTPASEFHDIIQSLRSSFAAQFENRQITLHLDTSIPLPESFPPAPVLQRLLRHLLACQISLVPKSTALHLHFSPLPPQAGSLQNHPAVNTQLVRLEPLALLLLQQAGEVLVWQSSYELPALGLHPSEKWSCWITPQPVETAPSPPNSTEIPPTADQTPLILLADDQETLASVLGNYLEDLGYRVTKASDGIEVVRLAQQLRPSLILMDLRMPLLSGLDALRQIRQAGDESTRGIPIICMSGFATAAEETRSLTAGANAFLRKPFRPADLNTILIDLLPPAATPSHLTTPIAAQP